MTKQPEADTARASAARVYNVYLGGEQNFAVDRAFADQMIATVPEVPIVARLNRAFLRRAVQACARAGVEQFLDIGSGIPDRDSTLDFAAAVRPDSRVVYLDFEPVAVERGRAALAGEPRARMGYADLRDPEGVLGSPEVAELLDLSRPVALLMLGVLHYVADEEHPRAIVTRYRDAVAPGSYLVVSHGTDDGRPEPVRDMIDLTAAESQNPAYMRGRAEIAAFLDGFQLLAPGVVYLPDWRPEPGDDPGTPSARVMAYGAVGRRP
ncbi:SAM-dependent methyltransferase [Dactylosporangium sp. CA-139066]|uniref:SAM-dependent methyltransferase n=1 Tax=Dactylosporangium sp. CA-139066 TaxID=3239930 RepID=UPI003D8DF55A